MKMTSKTEAKTPNLGEIASRIESQTENRFEDGKHIMALLGYETTRHGRIGLACRRPGDSHWQSAPSFRSADDFILWVVEKLGGELDDIGMNETRNEHYVSYKDALHGNDYGYSRYLGSAMWAAFIRVVGQVPTDE